MSAINQGLGPAETLWHVRAGLNVAALSCPSRVGDGIVRDYNAFLGAKRTELGQAYAQVSGRYQAAGGNWERAFDSDMTRLYNHFATPDAQPQFCAVAAREVKLALSAPSGADIGWAAGMLARLDQPFVAPAIGRPALLVAARATSPAVSAASGWRIQLGAFGSRANAERAWARISRRSAQIARMAVHYEPVPGRPLTRLQVANVGGRAQAISLCAQAAASGFDCFPVRAE